VRVLVCAVIWMNCISGGYASTPANPPPVATFDLSSLLPLGDRELQWTMITFVSETSIAIGLRSDGKTDNCSLSLVRWEGGVLLPLAQTAVFDSGASVHPANEGRVLTTTCYRSVLYSSDLSKSLRLPSSILVSPSGNTVAAKANRSWTVYRLLAGLELVRESNGSLRSLSDEVVVIQDNDRMRTETLEGRSVATFSVKPEKRCPSFAATPDNHRLYVDPCAGYPTIADLEGKTLLKLHLPTRRCSYSPTGSADKRRLLLDYTSREVSVPNCCRGRL
jgi:hypothetical protein